MNREEQNTVLFEKIATEILSQGWCVIPFGLPEDMANALEVRAKAFLSKEYKLAGVGRGLVPLNDLKIRSDEIHWIEEKSIEEKSIDEDTLAESLWLKWLNDLRLYLNQKLYLGLFSVESHFAHYPPEAFYQKHCDAFKGQANRALSVIAYLNKNWHEEDGGNLIIYGDIQQENESNVIQEVLPEHRTLVLFLSENFPHEVKPAHRDRYSIAGWFRVNSNA